MKVMVFGTFDILHLGHIDVFRQAKQYGDELIVVVSTDTHVKKIKGKIAVHTQQERATLLAELKDISKVVLGSDTDVYTAIREEQPDVIALGYDQHTFVDALQKKLDEYGLGNTRIVRLEPYKESEHKSTHIKNTLRRFIAQSV